MKISYILFASIFLLSSSLSSSYYQNLPMGRSELHSFNARTYYYYKVKTDSSFKQKISITTQAENYIHTSQTLEYKIDIKHFYNSPSDEEITNIDYSWSKNLNYKVDKGYYYEKRTYTYEPSEDFGYLAIAIYSEVHIDKITINIYSHVELPVWLMTIIIIVNIITIILIIIGIRACLKTERGREWCKILCACCVALTCCFAQMGANAAAK